MGEPSGQPDKLLSRAVNVGTILTWLPSSVTGIGLSLWGRAFYGWPPPLVIAVLLLATASVATLISLARGTWPARSTTIPTGLVIGSSQNEWEALLRNTRAEYERKIRELITNGNAQLDQLKVHCSTLATQNGTKDVEIARLNREVANLIPGGEPMTRRELAVAERERILEINERSAETMTKAAYSNAARIAAANAGTYPQIGRLQREIEGLKKELAERPPKPTDSDKS